MKRALAFKLMVDPKDVRRAVALVLGESLTDEELNEQFFDRDPVEIFPPDGQEFEVTAGLTALMIAADLEAPAAKESKFARKMRELQEEHDKKKV